MSSEILFPIFIVIIGLLTLSLAGIFLNKIKMNRAKIRVLSEANQKSMLFVEKNAEELAPILKRFYGDKTEHYLKNIKKQNQVFCNQVLGLAIEYKPNIYETLSQALELINGVYVNGFYEASQNYNSQQPQQSVSADMKKTICMLSQMCNQEIDENVLDDPLQAQQIFQDLEEKVNLQVEELNQFKDLIDQLRQEKNDLRSTMSDALKLFELIYKQYQTQLELPENITFKKLDVDAMTAAFKLQLSQ